MNFDSYNLTQIDDNGIYPPMDSSPYAIGSQQFLNPHRQMSDLQVSSPRDRLHVDLMCGAGDKVHMLCEVPILLNHERG